MSCPRIVFRIGKLSETRFNFDEGAKIIFEKKKLKNYLQKNRKN